MSVPITALLNRARAGDRDAGDVAFASLYQELKRLAASFLRRDGATLSATALVHEAYIKLIPEQAGALEDRSHFFRLAAKAMRQILVDHARARSAEKRGGDWIRTEITDGLIDSERRFDLLAIDQALNRLGARDAQLVEIVEGYFFAGQTFEEIAAALGMSDRSVRRAWETARLLLLHDLSSQNQHANRR
jgi:RNA polymerase sigma factor (TIGR02999 family)